MDLTGTCDALAACVIDQSSPQCEAVGGADAELAANKVTVRSDGVYECDESNEAHNEETCNLISPTDCLESSVLPGCYFKYVTNAKLSDDMSSNCEWFLMVVQLKPVIHLLALLLHLPQQLLAHLPQATPWL